MSKPVLCIASYLDILEDSKFSKKSRTMSLTGLNVILQEKEVKVTPEEVQRILTVSVKFLKEDLMQAPHGLTAALSLLKNAKVIQDIPAQDLLPSALAVLNSFKTMYTSVFKVTDNLRYLCMQVFLAYPTDVLSMIVKNHSAELIEIFTVLCPQEFQLQDLNKSIYYILKSLLTRLPKEEKLLFIKDGISVWLGEFIPLVMNLDVLDSVHYNSYLMLLETLVEDLVEMDYCNHPLWTDVILKSVCDSKKYPKVINKLLTNNSDIWHRLWIVLVKLLKTQLTRSSPFGTPIQSMLTVVESGFKTDTHKVRAFKCWDTLIDILATDTTPKCVLRYIKLLLIPMKVNNAKNESTVMVKFNTWWKFIQKFQNKLDQYTDEVVITFLQFAFGNKDKSKARGFDPVASNFQSLRHLCLQAFVQIVGHNETCNCCKDLTKLNNKLLNTKLLTSHLEDWMFALNKAIIITYDVLSYQEEVPNDSMQVLCIWNAFVKSISTLPPNSIRSDLFEVLLKLLANWVNNNQWEKLGMTDAIFSIIFSLVLSLLDNNDTTRMLLKSEVGSLHNIVTIILHPKLLSLFRRYGTKKMAEMLNPLTDLIVESNKIEWFLVILTSSTKFVANTLWVALAQSAIQANKHVISIELLSRILKWPLTFCLKMDEYCSSVWRTLYDTNANKLDKIDLQKEVLCRLKNENRNLDYFEFVVTISLLKHQLSNNEDVGINAEKLKKVTKNIPDYKVYESAIPLLIDTLVVLLNKICLRENIDSEIGSMTIECVKNILKLIVPKISADKSGHIKLMVHNLNEAVNKMYNIPEYKHLHIEFRSKQNNAFDVSQVISSQSEDTTGVLNEPQTTLTTLNNNKIVKEFTPPNVKAKKSKKETSIVKTVVENGEEYVVVKSNWRFNPKKLTENQKEKLQRKREDIPALYQDLSQSQDEFNMKSWKTDSQDTTMSASTSDSKSTEYVQKTNENASNNLKTIDSFDLVPNIMKNIINQSDKNETNTSAANAEQSVQENVKQSKNINPVTPKNTKSPRMALKDRVFRNVRNLIEKSSPINSTSDVNVADCLLNDVLKTPPPINHKNNADSIQSAPSALTADRPSRMKRKPKKYDDVQLFGLKKKRLSQSDIIPDTQLKTALNGYEETKSNKIGSDEETKQSQAEKDTHEHDTNEGNLPLDNNNPSDVKRMIQVTVIKEDLSEDIQEDQQNAIDYIAQSNFGGTVPSNVPNYEDNTEISVNCNEKSKGIEFAFVHQEKHKNGNKEKPNEDVQNHICEDAKKNGSNESTQNMQENRMLHNIENDPDIHNKINDKDKICNNEISETNKKTESDNVNNTLKTPIHKTLKNCQKALSTGKKSTTRKSRLEKELAIDMVAGHPFLKKLTPDNKRLTRKKLTETEGTNKRRSCPNDVNKTNTLSKISPRGSKKTKNTNKASPNASRISSITVEETQEKKSPMEDLPCSEDVIESSQDSTLTTISVKSTKRARTRVPVVSVIKLDSFTKYINDTQDLLQNSGNDKVMCETNSSESASDSKDDIELPQNKTAEVNRDISELTENMDTEPVEHEKITNDVIIIDDEQTPVNVSSQGCVGQETQEIADADTQPNNPADFVEFDPTYKHVESQASTTAMDITELMTPNKFSSQDNVVIQKQCCKNTTELSTSKTSSELDTDVCSPFKDDTERKQDFLNNTSEISPIKVQSPDKEKSPEKQEETSSDYLVVKLSSPVHSNGEPYHSGSPEFFSEDKMSPERDQSPPRTETSSSTGSPSTSLSLKKNRPQAKRTVGRAAHMLGLLSIPDSLKHSDKTEPEEPKKVSTSTPARRNLRVLYNAVGENNDNNLDEDEKVSFLKLKKLLPSVDSSPSVPILKRKLDVADDNTASPAGKRKRVSFHDPPVSTTVAVQKYIEPLLNRSPSSSHKRQITRTLTKSPKRLDSVFKLDTVLSKTVESFKELTDSLPNDTNISLDVTPAVEVVNTSELNDTDPICAALVACEDPIENIALQLSSPAMKDLLIKELNGTVVTIGDLAKMSELEVNRLCIKAPKVEVVKKVLADYIINRPVPTIENITENKEVEDETVIGTEMDEEMTAPKANLATIDTQTDDVLKCDAVAQTKPETVKIVWTQTDNVQNKDTSVQTLESGFKTTSEIISACLVERPDFVERLCELIPEDKLVDMVLQQPDFNSTLSQILYQRCKNLTAEERTAMELDIFKVFLISVKSFVGKT